MKYLLAHWRRRYTFYSETIIAAAKQSPDALQSKARCKIQFASINTNYYDVAYYEKQQNIHEKEPWTTNTIGLGSNSYTLSSRGNFWFVKILLFHSSRHLLGRRFLEPTCGFLFIASLIKDDSEFESNSIPITKFWQSSVLVLCRIHTQHKTYH